MKNVTRVVLMVFLVCLCQLAGAIDLFWVGGTGNWNDPNNWSFTSGGPGGDGVPSSFDDVFFDANSFDAPGQAVTIDGDVFVRSMDWTGVTNDPQMIGTNAFTIFMDGSLTFSPDMFHLFEGSYQFESNDPGNTITSAGQVFFEEVTFNGNGEWTLVDNFGVALAINIERGTFNSGGNDIITFTIFSDTELERTIDFSTSTIRLEELTGSNNPSQLILGGNNLNFSGADANVQVRGLNGRVLLNGPSNFEFGEIIFFTENSTLESQTTTPPTIGNLNFQLNGELIGDHIIDSWTLSMGQTVFISNGSRQLVDDIVTGDDCDGLANLIVRDNAGPTATIEFTFTPTFLEGLFLRGVEAQTPDGFAVPLFRSQDGGNNGDGWSFQSLDSRDLYWVGGSGDWNDRANWSESSGGPGGACIPKPNDNLFFDDNSFSSSNDVVSGIIPGFANNISYTSSIEATIDLPEIYINNNVDLLTLVNWNIENVYLVGNDEAGGSSNTDFQNINTGPNTLINLFSQSSRRVRLTGDLMVSGTLNISGAGDIAEFITQGFSITTTFLVAANSPVDLNLSSSTIIVTGMRSGLMMPVTINQIGTITSNATIWRFTAEDSGLESDRGPLGTVRFEGETGESIVRSNGTIDIDLLEFLGNGILTNETINIDTLYLNAGRQYQIAGDVDFTINNYLEARGNICSPITISSDAAGFQSTINMTNEVITDMSFVEIQDIAIGGGGNFYAGDGSANLGNNLGWTFPSEDENNSIQDFLGGDIETCGDQTVTLMPFEADEVERLIWNGTRPSLQNFEGLSVDLVAADRGQLIAQAFFEDGCSLSDTIEVTFDTPFRAEISTFPDSEPIGPDTTLCYDEQLRIGRIVSGASYQWSTGSTQPAILLDESGLYAVTVTRGFCDYTDSLDFTRLRIDSIEIGIDTTMCEDTPLNLTAPPVSFGSYLWSNGSTEDSTSFTTNGFVWLEVQEDRCSFRDSLFINHDPSIEVRVGEDTLICDGAPFEIIPTSGFESYNWSTGENTESIVVNSENDYIVTAQQGACFDTDTITVSTSIIDSFSIGEDQTLCVRDTLTLSVPSSVALPSMWSDGSTQEDFIVSNSGTYWLEIQEDICTRRDSITVSFETAPTLSLGPDTLLCQGQSITLSSPFANAVYQWSDNSTDSTLTVSTAGEYGLELQVGACEVSDSIIINYDDLREVDLGSDVSLCEGQQYFLQTTPQENASISWFQDDMTIPGDSTLAVTTTGTYRLEVSRGNCNVSDEAEVTFNPSPDVTLGNDTILCAGATLPLVVAPGADSYIWNTGVVTNEILVSSPDTYVIQATSNNCSSIDSIRVDYLDLNGIELGEDRIGCEGETFMLDATVNGANTYRWNNITTGQSLPSTAIVEITEDGFYSVVIEAQGCSAGDTVNVSFDPAINFAGLGNDTSFCEGPTLIFDLTATGTEIVWQDNTTEPVYNVNSSGAYSAQLTRGACQISDTITIDVLDLPEVVLPDTASACQGSTLQLEAMATNVTYLWSTGATTPSIDVSTEGLFTVEVDDGTCTNIDSAIVNLVAPPEVTLRPDTTICGGVSVTLDASLLTTTGDSYVWSNGSFDPIINVSDADTYTVTVTNSNNCSASDSFVLSVDETPVFSFPETIDRCEGETATLTVSVPFENIIWSTGATGNEITVGASDIYWAEATTGVCSFRDSSIVTVTPIPSLQLDAEATICEGEDFLISPVSDAQDFSWSTGELTSDITVSTGGTFTVTATTNGCSDSGSIMITANPSPIISLPNSVTTCEGEETILDPGQGTWTSDWSTGETTRTITVNGAGTYTLTATVNGCSSTASTTITQEATPVFDLGDDFSRCDQISTTLVAPINGVDILWNTGEIGNSIIIDEPGTYSATAMTAIGCSFTDDITITDRECGRFRIYVPNVFAPTGSEENSKFFVSPSEGATIIEYELRVFDRWGNNIYTTNDINAEWDGRTPTHSVQPGVFTYVIVVRYSDDFEEDRTERRSGSFTVLR